MSVIKDLFRTSVSHIAGLGKAFGGRKAGKVKKNRHGRPGVVKGHPFGHYIRLRVIWVGKTFRGRHGLLKTNEWLHATKGPRVNFKMPTTWLAGRPWHVAGRQDLLPRPKSTRRHVPRAA